MSELRAPLVTLLLARSPKPVIFEPIVPMAANAPFRAAGMKNIGIIPTNIAVRALQNPCVAIPAESNKLDTKLPPPISAPQIGYKSNNPSQNFNHLSYIFLVFGNM